MDTPTLDDPRPVDLAGLAVWFEARMDEAVGWRSSSRLYGLSVIDPDGVGAGHAGAVRVTFVADGDPYVVLPGHAGAVAARYDAIGLCCFGIATEVRSGRTRRCRTVVVGDRRGLEAVNRVAGGAPESLGRPRGPLAELLWSVVTQRHLSQWTDAP
jgi:hypothetical protein